jgi:hypothetical protein
METINKIKIDKKKIKIDKEKLEKIDKQEKIKVIKQIVQEENKKKFKGIIIDVYV